ncbi:hypothetical protein [Flavobacterium sp. '19STA2R22 D10 B1']|uniref:hypothetical protein n=1 Tax=Flavobacterium aerium TaxID=3037261 RepID=UPI00278BF913|nr:hypothetical protein [Flavobacterium sp. '19STA2R22 D10 B1']
MNKYYCIILSLFFLSGCKEKVETKKEAEKKDFQMYEMSPMAALMEQMYVDNGRIKERIVNGEPIGDFPDHFVNIYQSRMTDESENDAFFKEQAALFLEAEQLIFKDSANAKKHFNEAINACIRCHETKCGGPIPRIRKLLIQ